LFGCLNSFFAVFGLSAGLKAIGQKSGGKHFSNRGIVIHNQDGFASGRFLGAHSISTDCSSFQSSLAKLATQETQRRTIDQVLALLRIARSLEPAVLRTEVCMQDHSRLKSGRIILAPHPQFFFRIGTFVAGKNANKRRQLDPICFHTVINAMVLSVCLQNYKLFFVHSGPPSTVK
jgi:hypothetical protein